MKDFLTVLMCLGCVQFGWSQQLEHVEQSRYWLDGFARTWFVSDAIRGEQSSSGAISSGWNLLDLNPHVNPTEEIEVFAQIRVLNEFGGFFGQGTQVDVRQLRVSGVLKNKVKFNIGDIYLNQSEFTLHADEGEIADAWGHAFDAQRRLVSYENFFEGNRWRLQGAQANFTLRGDRGLESVVFDGYLTRPLGSRQVSESNYTPDRILAGITSAAFLQHGWSGELHHAVLADLPNSGTVEHNVTNPVTHGKIHKQHEWRGGRVKWTTEGGWSNHAWRIRDLANSELDSLVGSRMGSFAGFQGYFLSSDSSWRGRVGYREVDPFFRSSGAQSKRYDFSQHSSPSIWPNLGLQGTARQASLFDVYSDVALGNQSISPTLMPIAPLFDNVLPYGIATPNRRGAELALEKSWNTARLKLDLAWFEELTGQGTAELRSFEMAGFGFEWTPTYGMDREFRLSVFEQLQHTNRGGSDLESVELMTSNLTVSAQAELWPRCWVECSGRHAIGKGHEFLNVRSELGELFNFERVDLNTQAWMTSLGVRHGLSEEVVARLQWNFWGQHIEFDNQRRLLASQVFVVISATL